MRNVVAALMILAASTLPAGENDGEYSGRWYYYDHYLIYKSVDGGRLACDSYGQAGQGLEGPFTADFLPGRKIALVKYRGEKEILSWEPGRGEPCFYTVDHFGVRLKHTLTPLGPGRYLAIVEQTGGAAVNQSLTICVYSRER